VTNQNVLQKLIVGIFLLMLVFPIEAQENATRVDEGNEIEVKVDIVLTGGHYTLKLEDQGLFYMYIISGEPIPELEDQDLFINIVDSENHGWPVVEAGYIDTRYGVKEFQLDLHGKNFYLIATNGKDFSEVSKFDFHVD
jgi:hypothetical protein